MPSTEPVAVRSGAVAPDRRAAVRAWSLAIAYMATIFAISSLPRIGPRILLFPHFDKVLHLVVYAGLSVLLARALRDTYGAGTRPLWLPAAAILAALYGVSDEWHQAFVPGRTASLADVAADAVGAAIAAGLFPIVEARWPRLVA